MTLKPCQSVSFSETLDSPDFLSTTMHFLCLISLPIHTFGAICIVFKTPAQMKNMKWPMLNLHLWSISFDFSFNFLVIPFMYQPVLAGYSLGLLNEFSVPLKDMFYLCVVQIGGVMISVAFLFETRFYILYARETFWKHLRRPWLILNYLLALTYMIPTFLSIPDQVSGKQYQFARYPCLPKEVYDERVFLLTTYSGGVAYNMCLNTAGQQTLVFVVLIFWNMRKSMVGVKMSKKTLEMQRAFLRALILQVTIPIITVMLPLTYNTIVVYYSYYNQGGNNISTCIMSTHGLVSTMAMIYLHKSYWAVLKQTLNPKWSERKVFTLVHLPPNDFIT